MMITTLFFWLFFSVLVGILAHNRGRVGFGWFVLSVMLSPLLMGLLVLVLRDASRPVAPVDNSPQIRCPDCRELIRADARKCKHCGITLIPQVIETDRGVWTEIAGEVGEAIQHRLRGAVGNDKRPPV